MTERSCRACAHARWECTPSGRYRDRGECIARAVATFPACWHRPTSPIALQRAVQTVNEQYPWHGVIFRSMPETLCPCWEKK